MKIAAASMLIAMLAPSASVVAQSFPSKPFTIIVVGLPGGAPDVLARTVGQQPARARIPVD